MKKFFEDFKKFITKGNVIDMAVGVVIGGAFGKIVSSLVADIITPFISLLTGCSKFSDVKAIIRPEVLDEAGEIVKAEVAVTYGNFIQTIIDFLIIAFSIFLVLRIIMRAQENIEKMKKAALLKLEGKKPEEIAPDAPTTKICPFCMSEIHIDATRCPHCTSELNK